MSLPELPDKLYYSITEIADHFDVAPSLLRYWESEFSSISPKRNKKGTRFYNKKDIDEIRLVHYLVKEQGFTIKGARERLKKERKSTQEKIDAINGLKKVRSFLAELKENIG